MKNIILLLLVTFTLFNTVKAQTFPCNGDFLLTRQVAPSTFISKVNFIPNDINLTNPLTVSPNQNTNATVQYNGYIWTQQWGAATFTLLRVNAAGTYTAFTIPSLPTVDRNNAGVDRNGIMYILENGTADASGRVNIYAIDLSTGTPTAVAGFPKLINGLVNADVVTWGDISIDPITNRIYCWYHPTGATASLLGLYEITNITTATPTLVKRGAAQAYTLGSLFFNERGQLFGYGSSTLGGAQDRIFAIDKLTGLATQYGLPDISVSQSDGCECAFRISLDRQVSTPLLNIPKCGVDTFRYTFTPRNYSNGGAINITFSDTIDVRLSYAFSVATLQTQLQATYGGAVIVTLSNDGGGTNNVVNITGLNIPVGQNSFSLQVEVDSRKFNSSFTTNEQAYLKGISTVLGGPNEPSNDPTTFNPKDATPITINLTGTKCLPPVANNFINTPMPQGNGATAIPSPTASDPDGTVTAYTIKTVPAATEGVLSVPCGTIAAPTPTGATCTGGFANLTPAVLAANSGTGGIVLTPAQIATMRFDPVANFTGNAQFTFTGTDNVGNVSNIATYVLPVTAQPPVSNNIMENSMINTNGPTAIGDLNSVDIDGSISGYFINTLPTIASGVLSVPCGTVANPTLLGSSCSGGFQVLNAAVLSNYPSGIPLTATQQAGLLFDPTAAFTGNAIFNYSAIDNSGNLSNVANYTIPVTATATVVRPPLANNITAQPINNSLGPVAVPPLRASDLDGTVASYTITSVPPLAQGVVSIACGTVANPTLPGATCTGGFQDITAAVLTANGGNIVLTTTQINTLRFDPAPGFIGTATFNYFATDNTSLVSNPAVYTIPVVNTPPIAININTIAPFNGAAAQIVPLSGTDADGTVTSFNIRTVPTAAQGVLSVPCGTVANPTLSGATCSGGFQNLTPAVLTANANNIVLTPTQAAGIRFAATTGYSGAAPFTYNTTDNNGLVSSIANYNITIPNQPPISNDITFAVMPNTNGVTSIAPLNSTDPDGTIVGYTLFTIPAPTSGAISTACGTVANPTLIGATCTGGFQDITAAVLANYPNGLPLTNTQMSALQFDPAANYTGVVNFTYSATDNSGNNSNVATFNIPISGVGNLPPIAQNIIVPAMPSTNGAIPVMNLVATDPDGTIANYTITSVPLASQGILSIACGTVANPTLTGATCSGGFQDLTAAVLAANGGNIVLTTTQITTLRFDPLATFSGTSTFNYFATDNSGNMSNFATYTIPVTSTPPVANPVVAPAMPQTNVATVIPTLVGSDADGTIVSYQIETLPPTTQGVLSVLCGTVANPTLIGGSCVSGYQELTPAILANYPNGIPLTPTQAALPQFDPSGNYSGNVLFNYHVTDNSGAISNSTTYTIPITGQPPVSNDILSSKLLNTSGATPISGLVANDADGTIASYSINSLPATTQGVLSVPCGTVANPTPAGATCSGGFADLTAAVLAANPGGIPLTATQAAALRFDPEPTFIGDVIFNYTSFDNNGNISNVAAYVIPVGSSLALPVGLLNFTGSRVGNNIALSWKSENEVNLNKYEIYYSIDGANYTYAGAVTAKNQYSNSYDNTLYNYTAAVYYIKLKIVDKDGAYKYSNIITIRNNNVGTIAIYPNPVKNVANIELGASAKGNYTLQLFDAAGKLIHTQQVVNAQPNQLVQFNRTNNMANGVYILKVNSTYFTTTTNVKLIIE